MYVITKQAAVWAGDSADAVPQRTPRPSRIQRWAEKPLNTPSGTARAIRFDGEYARVLVERNGKRALASKATAEGASLSAYLRAEVRPCRRKPRYARGWKAPHHSVCATHQQ